MSEKELHKGRECAKCKHIFDCKGKPREVKLCIRYEEREEEWEKTRTKVWNYFGK